MTARPIYDDAMREAAAGRVELTAGLLKLSVDELAACDPAIWERIGSVNRAALLHRLDGSPGTARTRTKTASVVHAPPNSRRVEVAWMLNRVPIPARGLVAGLLSACLCVGLIASWLVIDPTPIAPVVTSEGECPRLMMPAGSCFYRVRGHALTWAAAAASIGVEERALRAGNHALTAPPPVRGSTINISPSMAYGPHD